MPTITISEQDRRDAELYIESYLKAALPTGDFSRGSFLRDLVVSAMSYTVAYLRAEAALALDRSSVKRIAAMTPGTDRDEAADDAMSNWFLSRKTGRPSRGSVLVHLSAKVDVAVPLTARFYSSPSLSFKPDYAADVVIPASDVIEISGADGTIADRYVVLNLVATESGSSYDVQPSTWAAWTAFNAYVTRIESVAPFVGGASTESTDDFLARAQDAVSTRMMVTDRAIRTILKDRFTTVDDVVVVGAGDDEMTRDVVPATAVTTMHSGGFTDVYIRGPVVTAPVIERTLGGLFTDPRPTVTTLSTTASLQGVTPGMVLHITNTLPTTQPNNYFIESVNASAGLLTVSQRTPFPAPRSVGFTIGTVSPFNDVVKTGTGLFTRSLRAPGVLYLPAEPIYRINSVEYLSGGSWISVPSSSYTFSYADPAAAFSGYQLASLSISSTVVPNLSTMRVQYETVSGFSDVHNYTRDPNNRMVCADILVKALYPVYVDLTVNVLPLSTATPPTAVEVKQAVTAFFDQLPQGTAFRPALLSAYLLRQFSSRVAGVLVPVPVNFVLHSPDGQFVTYTLTSETSAFAIDPSLEPGAVKLPYPAALGVSSRTTLLLPGTVTTQLNGESY